MNLFILSYKTKNFLKYFKLNGNISNFVLNLKENKKYSEINLKKGNPTLLPDQKINRGERSSIKGFILQKSGGGRDHI